MKLRFTHHSQFRINERGISIEEIKLVIKHPDFSDTAFGDKTKVNKEIEGKILEIVYKKDGNDIVIITAYHL